MISRVNKISPLEPNSTFQCAGEPQPLGMLHDGNKNGTNDSQDAMSPPEGTDIRNSQPTAEIAGIAASTGGVRKGTRFNSFRETIRNIANLFTNNQNANGGSGDTGSIVRNRASGVSTNRNINNSSALLPGAAASLTAELACKFIGMSCGLMCVIDFNGAILEYNFEFGKTIHLDISKPRFGHNISEMVDDSSAAALLSAITKLGDESTNLVVFNEHSADYMTKFRSDGKTAALELYNWTLCSDPDRKFIVVTGRYCTKITYCVLLCYIIDIVENHLTKRNWAISVKTIRMKY